MNATSGTPEDATGDSSVDDLLSSLHHVLRTTRRRHVITLLTEAGAAEHTVRSLARQITARELDVPTHAATGEPYRNVYNALSQTHLPTLLDAGIIVYDPDRQTVSPGRNLKTAALLVSINRPAIELFDEG